MAEAVGQDLRDSVPGIDEATALRWLESLPIGLREPVRYATVGQGKSNITVVVSDATSARWILRRPPLGELLASAHDVSREYRVLSALEPTPVPTPAVIALTTDESVTHAPLLLMEYVDGLVVDEMPVAEGLTPALRGAIGRGMVDALAAIHDVDLESTGLTDLASHKPYAQRQLKRWSGQWEAARTRELPEVDELARRLAAAAPEQTELTLVHGDFHLRNVIVDPVSGAVRAVLDWELCTLGDPLADLGGLLAYWPEADDPPGAPFLAPTLEGFPTRDELTDRYGQVTGRDLTALGFWHVLALWKVAIIVEGVYRRSLNDRRNAARGATVDPQTVEAMLARAVRTADAVGL
jgi:aminoglycoside phosphotransferase (APT) family kinase protein